MNPGQQQEILKFSNVSLTFNDETRALDNVSIEVRPGETLILFGAAGSGKSVLLKTAIGLLRPSEGSVELFGENITTKSEEELFEIRPKVGILFQESALFDSLTVADNVAYPLRNQRQSADPGQIENRVRESLRFVELEHTMDKFPSELSGGMRRRVGIARAAVTEPPLMLYDSPTAGLDPITANTIIALIIKGRDTKNTSSIIVTHRYQDGHMLANYRYNSDSGKLEHTGSGSDIHKRTRFLVFQEGKLVFTGTQEELEQSQDPYISKFKAARLQIAV